MQHRIASAVVLLVLFAGCNRNVEPYVEGEQPRRPDLARIFPDSGDSPGARAGAPPAGPMAASSRPGMPAPPAREGGDAEAATIHGRIELDPGLGGSVPAGATLFIIARNAGAAGGPPLAVRRIANPELPLDFEIGPQHAMIQGMPFAGQIQITVRLDGDGDAMTRRAGDLAGEVAEPVAPGTRGVQIVLDQRI
jgi:hypothetical protein